MPRSKTYLVPIDFSRGSEIALTHAAKLARENGGKLLLVHIVPPVVHFGTVSRFVRGETDTVAKRLNLDPTEYRLIVLERPNAARTIADLAKKFRAAMIVMSSHGRTGFQRLMLGSVAEKTLRYADCPVLIVKE
jgi:nucleotide-binding universal stress UspA family protein